MSIRRIADRAFDRGHALPAATGPAGTAHGPAIDLKPRAGATTGGYMVIDQPQANAIMDELEREQAINPITMERPELRASIFRVEARTPKPNGDPRYSYWDPAELWRWLKQPERQGRMPDTNEPAWFEDWWALYYTYGAPNVPQWAFYLEKRDYTTSVSGLPERQNIQPSDGRMQAFSNRNPERAAARAAAVAQAAAGGGLTRRPRRRAGIFAEDSTMETQEEANARADREGVEQARRQQEWDEWQSDLRNLPPPPPMGRTPTLSEDGAAWWRGEISREEAYHLAEAERYRSAAPGSAFGGSNEQQEEYHRNQAALAAARRASADTPPNPFGAP